MEAAATAAPSAPSAPTSTAPSNGATTTAQPPAQGASNPSLPSEPGASTATQPRVYTQKINGVERQVPADAIDAAAKALGLSPDEFLQASQLKAAAYQRFEEAKKAREEAERIKSEHAKRYADPRIKALVQQRPGLTEDDALAFIRVQEMMEREQMSPEQRALAEERQRREGLERQIQEQEKAKADAQRQQEVQAHTQRFNAELPQAMEEAGLPRDPAAARLVLEHVAKAAQLGMPIDLKWAARDAMQVMMDRYAPLISRLPPERLVQVLGKEAIDGLQKHLIAKAQTPTPQPTPRPPEQRQQKPQPYGMTPDQWRARMLGNG